MHVSLARYVATEYDCILVYTASLCQAHSFGLRVRLFDCWFEVIAMHPAFCPTLT